MDEFLSSVSSSLSGVSAGIYAIGAVLIAFAANIYIIGKIRSLLGDNRRGPDPMDPNDERNYPEAGNYDDDLARYGK